MIKIVKYDWLEDSLQSKSRKPKDTAAYDWEQKRLGHKPTAASSPPCPLVKDEKPSAEAKVEKIDRKSKYPGTPFYAFKTKWSQ